MKTITILTLSFILALSSFTGAEERASTVSSGASEQTVIDIDMLNPFSIKTSPYMKENGVENEDQVCTKCTDDENTPTEQENNPDRSNGFVPQSLSPSTNTSFLMY